MKKLPLKPIVLAIGAVSFGLAGCGGSDQDAGASSKVAVSGLALDGYLARAEVFQDVNGNNVRDAFEVLRFTDNDGYYSYNPLTQTNYCAATTSKALRDRHCLEVVTGNYPIVTRGGYDLATGEPFHGNMRKMVNVRSDRDITENDVISPITTILSYVPTADLPAVKDKLGVSDTDLNRDFLNRSSSLTGQTEDINLDRNLIKVTQQIHKTITAASKIVEQTYNFEAEKNLPNDASSYMYSVFARDLSRPSISSVVDLTTNVTNLSQSMRQVRQDIEAAYSGARVTIPSGAAALSDDILDANSLNSVTRVSSLVDVAVNNMPNVVPTLTTTQPFAKVIEVSVEKISRNRTSLDVQAIIDAMNDSTSRAILLTEFSKPSTNITSLIDVDFSDTTAVTTVTNISYLPVFAELANKQLALGEADLAAKRDLSAILYFSIAEGAEATATSGTLVACVRYIDGLEANGNLKSEGTLATHTNAGTWSQLNSGFSMLLDLEFAGAKRQATIQFGGPSGSEYIYRTDIGDELKEWTGPALTVYDPAVTPVPTNDAECKTALDTLDPIDTALLNQITGV